MDSILFVIFAVGPLGLFVILFTVIQLAKYRKFLNK